MRYIISHTVSGPVTKTTEVHVRSKSEMHKWVIDLMTKAVQEGQRMRYHPGTDLSIVTFDDGYATIRQVH